MEYDRNTGCSLKTQQLKALLKKSWTEKRRSKMMTCMEIVSPIFIISILAFAFTLSAITIVDEAIYTSVEINIPGNFEGFFPDSGINEEYALDLTTATEFVNSVHKLTTGPFPVPSFDQYVAVSNQLSSNLDIEEYNSVITNNKIGRTYGNLLTLGTLHFAPSSSAAVQQLQIWLDETTVTASNLTRRLHESEESAVDYALKHLDERTWAVISISEAEPRNVDYTIRLNYTTVPNTNIITDFLTTSLNDQYFKYYASGFLTLQATLDQFLYNYTLAADQECVPPSVLGTPMPTAQFNQNIFFTAVGFLLGLAMTLSTLFPVSRVISRVVEEKETRMRETMKIMGLYSGVHDISWFISNSVIFIFLAIAFTLVATNSFLPNSDPSLLFAFFITFLLGELNLALLLSCFFNRAKLAALVGPVILFAAILPRYIFYGTNRYEAASSKFYWSLLSPTAFTFGADFIADYEYAGVGASWSNYHEGTFSLASCLGMLIFDFFLYGILAWYFDKVLPRQFGTPLHPLFFLGFKWGMWGNRMQRTCTPVESPINALNFEEPTSHLKGREGVRLYNLKKNYGSTEALKGVNLTMYEGQIMCYLGHNGAGKSTTIGICTGLTPPSSGDCLIWGKSVSRSSDLAQIRQNMGLCPQHNTLFPLLTVREHLELFGAIKGLPSRCIDTCVVKSAEDVGLVEKMDSLSSSLSGGQKRKLSLAVALTANPTFLLCDEPTSGVDPYSRRAIWDVLRKNKSNRVIMLTTHSMEEADLLGDRISIVNHGVLQCVGSSLFLKNRFGVGYNLNITKRVTSDNNSTGDTRWLDLNQLVLGHVDGSHIITQSNGEVCYRLPLAEAGKFPGLFRTFDEKKDELEIGGYGISVTSLEEVFIHLENSQENSSESSKKNSSMPIRSSIRKLFCRNAPTPTNIESAARISVPELATDVDTSSPLSSMEAESANYHSSRFTNHQLSILKWLIWKRYIVFTRDKKNIFFQLLLPALLILLVLAILTIDLKVVGPSIPMNSSQYESNTQVLFSGEKAESVIYPAFELNERADWVEMEKLNSTSLSKYMLRSYNDHERDTRYGAFVFGDSIPVNATVDWAWLKENKEAVQSALISMGQSEIEFGGQIFEFREFEANNPEIVDNAIELLGGSDRVVGSPTDIQAGIETLLVENDVPNAKVLADAIGMYITGGNDANETMTVGDLNDLLVSKNVTLAYSGLSIDVSTLIITLTDFEVSIDETLLVNEDILMIDGTPLFDNLPSDNRLYTLNVNTGTFDTVLHNSSSYHGLPCWIGELTALKYRSCLGDAEGVYITRLHPLPMTAQQSIEQQTVLSLLACLFIIVPLCYAPAAFVVFIVRERHIKSKSIQLLSGATYLSYWLATYIWDLFLFAILVAVCMGSFYAYGNHAARIFVEYNDISLAILVLLELYGASVLPLCYLYTFLFENHSVAQISIMAINFFTGWVFVLAYFVLVNIEKTKSVGRLLVHFFRLFPPFNVGEGLINVSRSYYERKVLEKEMNAFDWLVSGRSIIYMAIGSVVFFALVLMLEKFLSSKLRVTLDKWRSSQSTPQIDSNMHVEDQDVITEEKIISFKATSVPINLADHTALMHKMTKVYPPPPRGKLGPKWALRGLSLGIKHSECLGLLGVNGAGKTTTLGILSQELKPTSGGVFIKEETGEEGINAPMFPVGYCPQVDPLIESMTARETLRFYGGLRGISAGKGGLLETTVQSTLRQVGLEEYADRRAGIFSGGNKRKLSLAIALMGNPILILLDEPSSGMDPVSKRKMWNVINNLRSSNPRCSVLLTTHSMEESEALCSRIGILREGLLQCLGSCQHLKTQFGGSYSIQIQFSPGGIEGVKGMMKGIFPEAVLDEDQGTLVIYNVPAGAQISLADAFETIENEKNNLGIIAYSISQSSLEQIFIKFARPTSPNPEFI